MSFYSDIRQKMTDIEVPWLISKNVPSFIFKIYGDYLFKTCLHLFKQDTEDYSFTAVNLIAERGLSAVPFLLESVKSDDPNIVKNSVFAINEISLSTPVPEAIPVLFDLFGGRLREANPAIISALSNCCLENNVTEVSSFLFEILFSSSAVEIRRSAAINLASLSQRFALPIPPRVFLEMLKTEKDPSVKCHSIICLGNTGFRTPIPEAFPVLIGFLDDDSKEIRGEAILAIKKVFLGSKVIPENAFHLVVPLFDVHLDVRALAKDCILEIGDESFVRFAKLLDPNEESYVVSIGLEKVIGDINDLFRLMRGLDYKSEDRSRSIRAIRQELSQVYLRCFSAHSDRLSKINQKNSCPVPKKEDGLYSYSRKRLFS